MGKLHRTERSGLEALWRLRKYRHIEIVQARDTASGQVIDFAPGTDLAAARERTSRRWAALWDGVCHEMWSEWMSGVRNSGASAQAPGSSTRFDA